MTFSSWINIKNTISILLFCHYFIISESISTFIFIHKYSKNLFFFNGYLGPAIILNDLIASLSQAILKIIHQNRSKVKMNVVL